MPSRRRCSARTMRSPTPSPPSTSIRTATTTLPDRFHHSGKALNRAVGASRRLAGPASFEVATVMQSQSRWRLC
jgi:hypothetical protein